MNRIIGLGAVLAMLFLPPAAAEERNGASSSWQYGVHGGTLGLGINAGYDISEAFTVRGLFSKFDYGFDRNIEGKDFDGDLKLSSLGLVADWHPLGNGLRLTAGVFVNNNKLKAAAKDEKLGIGDGEYDATLNARLAFERFAPYLGIGWTSGRGDAGFSFSVDAGAFYHGSPGLSATGSAGGCSFSVSKSATATVGDGCPFAELKTDLEQEHRELKKDLDLDWYPVLSVGVSYRF